MTYMRMPMFCWTALAANLFVVIAAFSVLTATLAMLILDRYLGFHFFTNEAGGNMMMFINLIWAWGHPEVPLHPRLAGLRRFLGSDFDLLRQAAVRLSIDGRRDAVHLPGVVHRLAAPFLHDGGWRRRRCCVRHRHQHHCIGTGVKVYNWMFTMYGGRIRYPDTDALVGGDSSSPSSSAA